MANTKTKTRFVLQPCRIREEKIVATKDDPLVLEVTDLFKTLVPSGLREERSLIRGARIGTYLGRCKGSVTGKDVLLVIYNNDGTNVIEWVLKRDPTLPDRVTSLFRLDAADWGSSFYEPEGPPVKETARGI